MSSYDKVVKLACKPKAAPPKAKYLDPIIAATWSEDGAVHDVCRALVPRFREPNAIIVFKALIVLHTMIRNGATDNVLSHLSSSEVLRLHNVSSGTWEGYNAPQNLQLYAMYLDSRIRAYRDLQHDAIRVQAESNRDIRLQNSLDEEAASSRSKSAPKSKGTTVPQRSKTIMGRKLRVMTVEKGLLRETKVVQKMIDAVVECRFYLDDLEDELTITALRMLVKDLLILFQAGNEGVINVLEHYFEMSHVDAEQALAIYRHFCKQAERVVEYLGVAKKLQNLLNVPIPNLKHAPVSLAGALEEYLNDPNFEQNRIEYKANKAAADKNGKAPVKKVPSSAPTDSKEASKVATSSAPPLDISSSTFSSPLAGSSINKAESSQAIVDFFSAIEEQPTIFNPQTGSPTTNNFQQQAAHNPFVQRQFTGALGTQPFGMQNQMHPQATGFPVMQQPFQNHSDSFGFQGPQQSIQQSQHRPFSSFLQSQVTGLPPVQSPAFLQPQATGVNPFRQSIMLPQTTGIPPFNLAGAPSLSNALQSQPFDQTQSVQMGPSRSQFLNSVQSQSQSSSQQSFSKTSELYPTPSLNIQFAQPDAIRTSSDLPARPASTPLRSFASSPPPMQPVKTHQTGSRNPFGAPVAPLPPVPKPPTLMELAMGIGGNGVNVGTSIPQSQPQQPQQTGTFGGFDKRGVGAQSTISNVASSFTLGNKPSSNSATPFAASGFGSSPLNAQATSTTTSSAFSDSLFSSSLSAQPTGATVTSSAPSISAAAPTLKPQITGFGGLKPFKPSSSFGASLLESLPPIPQSGSTTPAMTGSNPSSSTTTAGTPAANAFGSNFSSLQPQSTAAGAFNAQATGAGQSTFPSGIGVGLRPQATGTLGPVNPFRASMFPASTGSFGSPSFPSTSMPHFGAFGASENGMTGNTMSGSGLVSGDFSPNFGSGGQEASKQYQQTGAASLI
ncbi:hypothetical protein SERLA73DRAFT_75595 [Serpula lacrymans var. lacrymans S7.3]|uniref:ENTH domain-containing protein n=1 Tax=Serpula lacrymans var. lacrymans (strain S7.3) TaxID=936435 RepID=F8Q595_SERL3|nr:hypothetical protein SERLA73DRAFT_75595 [Serpula lacrymans var. lacrymans S7.3]